MTAHTPDALASALPAGIRYDVSDDPDLGLDVSAIARFQAERLAESGYVLVHLDQAAGEIMQAIREFPFWNYGMDEVDPTSEFAEWVPDLAAGALRRLADTPKQEVPE